MRRYSTIITLFTLFFINSTSPTTWAEDKPNELKPIEVIATRGSTTEENTPSSVTIITQKEIKKRQHVQVQDILREELGMNMVRNGSFGGSSSLFMRGTGSSSTLVLIDGAQANSNTSGAYDFRDLNVDNIERIEILRGPQSTLWGGYALGGVVNIVTKKGSGDPKHYLSYEGGSFGTSREAFGSSGGNKDYDYSLSVSRTDTAGFSSASESRGNTEKDGFTNTTVSARTGANFLDNGRVEFIGRYIKSMIGYDGFSFATGLPADAPNRNRTQSYYISVPLTKGITDWWNVKLAPQMAIDEFRTYDLSFSPNNSNIFNRTYTFDLQNNVSVNKNLSMVFGAEIKKQNGENVESRISRNIDNNGFYLQNVLNFWDGAVLTGGFRHDMNSAFIDKTTYKVEGAYRFKEYGTRIHSAHATGFRAPSMNDLFFPGFSNPNLKPEESNSWEVGVDQPLFTDRIQAGITYFDSDLTNLIQFDSATLMPQNVGKATSRGTESYLKIQPIRELGVSFNHTWNDALDGDGHPLRRRVPNKFTAQVHHNWQDTLSSLIGVTYKRGIPDGRFRTEDYAIVRAAISYQIHKNLKLTLRGENLFDEKYEELPGFGTAGVSGYAGLIGNF